MENRSWVVSLSWEREKLPRGNEEISFVRCWFFSTLCLDIIIVVGDKNANDEERKQTRKLGESYGNVAELKRN